MILLPSPPIVLYFIIIASIRCSLEQRSKYRYPFFFSFSHDSMEPASSIIKASNDHAFFLARISGKRKEKRSGSNKINQSAVTFLAIPPSPSKYYQVTYTCPTYQNLTYPKSTTMRHINVSKN